MVMFAVFGCGTSHEARDFLSFTLKNIPSECVVETEDKEIQSDAASCALSSRKRKAGMLERLDDINGNITALVSSFLQTGGTMEYKKERKRDEKRSELVDRLSQAVKIRNESSAGHESVKRSVENEIEVMLSLLQRMDEYNKGNRLANWVRV